MNAPHCMLDIETLGTGRDACMVSLGALMFDPTTGEIADLNSLEAMHLHVDLEKSSSPGTIDPSTVSWWMQQSQEARDSLFNPRDQSGLLRPKLPLETVLLRFSVWLESYKREGRDVPVWSNGPLFDERIIREASERMGLRDPFHFRSSRCFRTAMQLAKDAGISITKDITPPFFFIKHNALHDCWMQARAVNILYSSLGLQKKAPQ